MENAVNELTISLLSQPLFQFFIIIGMIGIFISIITKFKNIIAGIITFIIMIAIVSLMTTGWGFLSILAIGIIVFLIVKNAKNSNQSVKLKNEKINIEQDNICPKCGGILKKRIGKYGEFYGCSNYPNCKFVRKIDTDKNITVNVNITDNKDIEAINIENDNTKCPKCGGELKERNGKYGKFLGCSNYPKCKYTKK